MSAEPVQQEITFFVPGHPKTAGSKRAFMPKGARFPVVTDACKGTKDWQADVKRFAADAISGDPIEGPVTLTVTFYLPRPKSHYDTKGMLKASAPVWHEKRPDALKLARAVEDAMTGIVYRDDSQIVREVLEKRYGSRVGAAIEVSRL